jgi:hypothetical protein
MVTGRRTARPRSGCWRRGNGRRRGGLAKPTGDLLLGDFKIVEVFDRRRSSR